MNQEQNLDALIVGAGFAGLYALHRLRGLGLETRVLEAGSGIGGTWFWNRYPGARCDIESMEYSYQFSEELQQDWVWTERYASQPEILAYIQHVADRFDLMSGVQLESRVTRAAFDEETTWWRVETEQGQTYSVAYLVMATGCLSTRNTPSFEGLEDFEGACYHTGNWPHEGADFQGQRVGVIGTGSSAIQAIPLIADRAAELTVFQRTPNYSVPAQNAPLDPKVQAEVKANYASLREKASQMPFGANLGNPERLAVEATEEELLEQLEKSWQLGGLHFLGTYGDMMLDAAANAAAAAFVRDKIRGLVTDPEVANLLTPEQSIGCKRLCADTGYFETYNRPHVHLVDVRKEGIERITPAGLRQGGKDFEFDALVLATGFDAMTGALLGVDFRGKGGQSLREKWAEGPQTYLGLSTAGFPNLFIVTGPGSPSVLSNMLPSIEQNVNWIADCVAHLQEQGLHRIEASASAERDWMSHVREVGDATLFPTCGSWYSGANVPGKPRVFMPYIGFPAYVEKCEEVVANGYEGFELSADRR